VVVKALNGDKASGLEGFFLVFFQTCWEVLKEDIMNIFHEFHARGKFLNATLFPSFPKKVGAANLRISYPLVSWVACIKSSLKS
jgi:hypothetical protein